jgi:hypothetical protein
MQPTVQQLIADGIAVLSSAPMHTAIVNVAENNVADADFKFPMTTCLMLL